MIALEALNRLSPQDFTTTLSGIFEHSAWIAQRAATGRPFDSRWQLLGALRGVVQQATAQEQLALIQAHPRLGARGRARTELTAASSQEQRRAGLDACSDAQFAQLLQINTLYEQRFGFPFILAVRGHEPDSIIEQMQRRVRHERTEEVGTALHEIGLIAGYRLADLIATEIERELPSMRAGYPRGGSAPLMTEWMRSAGLNVAPQMTRHLLARDGHSTPGRTLMLGIHARAGSLQHPMPAEALAGIALVQWAREQHLNLPFALAVFAALGGQDSPPGTRGAPGVPEGCVSLQSIEELGTDGPPVRAALALAGLAVDAVDILQYALSQSPTDPNDCGRAMQTFLLHTAAHS